MTLNNRADAVRFDPAKPWSSGLAPLSTCSGKLEFVFGGSSGQARRQSRPASFWNHDVALVKGWLVATNSLIDAAGDSNRAVIPIP